MIIFSDIYAYSTASTSEAAYIIGGRSTEGVIAEFKNYSWRRMGKLVNGRSHHASITLNDETMVVGGYNEYAVLHNF